MSAEEIKRVIGRLLMDDEFRASFKDDHPSVLDDFDLTDKERAALSELKPENIKNWRFELTQEVTTAEKKIGLWLG